MSWKNVDVTINGELIPGIKTITFNQNFCSVILDKNIIEIVASESESQSKVFLDYVRKEGKIPLCTVSHIGVVYMYKDFKDLIPDYENYVRHTVAFHIHQPILSIIKDWKQPDILSK